MTKIRDEINKISAMNRAQKWSYYKTYYMWPTVAVVIGIVLLVWFFMDTFGQKTAVANGCAFGVELSDAQIELITDGYLRTYGYDASKYTAAVAVDNFFADTAQVMDAYSNTMAVCAQIAAGEIQYLILDETTLHSMETAGVYMEPAEVLSSDLYEQVSESIVCVTDENAKAYPAAIDLKAIGWLDDSAPDAYLVFTAGINDDSFADNFLKLLLE